MMFCSELRLVHRRLGGVFRHLLRHDTHQRPRLIAIVNTINGANLRNDDVIAGLQWNILGQIFSSNHIFIVERDALFAAENIDLLSVCKFPQPAGDADGL